MGLKVKYVGTVDTPVDADQLDDLSAHLTSVAELHQLSLTDLNLDMGGQITQISFEANVVAGG